MSQPWLSVIMPTYNGEAFLPVALNSILCQDDEQIEVIAVDDGSTDATVQILKYFATKLSLRIIQREHLGNWAVNTNYGLSLAQGSFVCFLHQDDHWLDARIRLLKPLLQCDPSITLLLHPSWFIDSFGNHVGLCDYSIPLTHGRVEPRVLIERLLVQNSIAIPAPIISYAAAVRVGGLDDDLWYTADWDFWLKLAPIAHTIYVPQPLSAFRIHGHSQTLQRSVQLDDFHRQLTLVLNRHLQLYTATYTDTQSVQLAAEFSVELNTFLASRAHSRPSDIFRLLWQLLAMGPAGCCHFLHYSRIIQRIAARLHVHTAHNHIKH